MNYVKDIMSKYLMTIPNVLPINDKIMIETDTIQEKNNLNDKIMIGTETIQEESNLSDKIMIEPETIQEESNLNKSDDDNFYITSYNTLQYKTDHAEDLYKTYYVCDE